MLKVWIPGTTDAIDQGLGGTEWINDNVTISNDGKLGKCLSFNGSTSRLSTTGFNLSNKWSFSLWVKDDGTRNSWQCVLMLNSSGSDSDAQLQFWLNDKYQSETDYPRFEMGANGKWASGIRYIPGQWNHFAGTYNESELLVYLNGERIYTINSAVEKLERYNLTIGGKATSVDGGHVSANALFKGLINDIRIWDNEVLSPHEIELISRGLVCHYPLSMPGQDNLLKNSATNFPSAYSGATMTKVSNVSIPEWGCDDALRVYGKSGNY